MIKNDFHIGLEFYTASGRWRCTDIGTRIIVAIKLDKDDPSWYAGPPYAVVETVFDEYDFGGCSLDPEHFAEFARDRAEKLPGRRVARPIPGTCADPPPDQA